jgi:hypothetical protein
MRYVDVNVWLSAYLCPSVPSSFLRDLAPKHLDGNFYRAVPTFSYTNP